MKFVVYVIGLGAGLVLCMTLLLTVLTNRWQFWPPGERTWKYYVHWVLVTVFNISVLVVAVLDWSTWVLPRPGSLVGGGVLFATGGAIFVYSQRALGSSEVAGLSGELQTEGPYARSRNPQYVGVIIAVVGFVLLVNSALVTVLAAVNIVRVVSLVFAEEPWLLAEYGEAYERYRQTVPRFVGRKTVWPDR